MTLQIASQSQIYIVDLKVVENIRFDQNKHTVISDNNIIVLSGKFQSCYHTERKVEMAQISLNQCVFLFSRI